MIDKVIVIDKEDLISNGIKLITETTELISYDGVMLDNEIKKCFLSILEADAEHRRIEHIKKIENGMSLKGVKRGRHPLSNKVQEKILELRDKGLTYEDIRIKLESEDIKVSTRTIYHYCRKGVSSNDR